MDKARVDYVHSITVAANNQIIRRWLDQKEKYKEMGHPNLHVGEAPLISHAQVEAVLDVVQHQAWDTAAPCPIHGHDYNGMCAMCVTASPLSNLCPHCNEPRSSHVGVNRVCPNGSWNNWGRDKYAF